MKRIICFALLILFTFVGMVNGELAAEEIQRLIKAKALLIDTETRTVNEIILDFKETGSAQDQLLVYEAVAATFRDIQEEYGEGNLQSRQQLLSKIQMNMAYFQLGGLTSEQDDMGELNRLIRRKLKEYLPEDIWNNPKLFHSLD